MGKISTYSFDNVVTVNDFLVGTDVDDSNATKSYLIGDIISLVPNITAQYVFQIKGTSYDVQSPLTTDTALQVEFGADNQSVNVEILSSGNISFVTAGNYLVNTFISVSKETNPGIYSVFAFRALINGVQVGDPKVFKISEENLLIPYELTVPIVAAQGDILTYEIIRDSSGDNSGRLEGATLLGWVGNTPSAQIEVWKNV
jgi:hypothetical protein